MRKDQTPMTQFALVDRAIKMLIDDYGCERDRIKTDYKIVLDSPNTKEVTLDIVVLDNSKKDIEVIVEITSTQTKLFSETQVDYLSFLISNTTAKYGILYGGIEKYYFKKILGNQIVEVSNIPRFDGQAILSDFGPIKDPQQKFWRMFNILRGKIDAGEYLDIMIILLYLKFIDEVHNNGKAFQNLPSKDLIPYLKNLYDKVGRDDFIIFNLNEIKLPENSLLQLLYEIKEFSISKSNPEAFAKVIFNYQHMEIGHKSVDSRIIPDGVASFMYKYLTTGGDTETIEFRSILLSDVGSGKTVLDVINFASDNFDLSGNELKKYCEENIVVTERNANNLTILRFLLLLKNFQNMKIYQSDSQMFISDTKFDCIVSLPPLFAKTISTGKEISDTFGKYKENHVLINMIQALQHGGFLCILLSPGFLFRDSERALRKAIVSQCHIRGIIQLPDFLSFTSIRPVLLLLQKKFESDKIGMSEKVFMADLDFRWTAKRSDDAILNEAWEKFMELNIIGKISETERYFYTTTQSLIENEIWSLRRFNPIFKQIEKQGGIKLQEIVDLIPGKEYLNQDINGKEVRVLLISDIDEDGFIKKTAQKIIKISQKELDSNVIPLIKENDLILSIKGTIGKVAKMTQNEVGSTVNSQLVIIRPNQEKYDSSYLFSALSSGLVKAQLEGMKYGTVIFGVRIRDLENIILPNPQLSKQRKIVDLQDKIKNYRKLLQDTEQELQRILKEDEYENRRN